ncbi:toprim domain-containing protein [uncultured Christiangramia sp.]|nr:toprim domain-containing protein [uncultured Christiangramia sp.]
MAREIDLIGLLITMGYNLKRQNVKEAWFLSPFRKETIPSFKVSKKLNRWYDHGEGIGGNTIDLIIQLKNCSVKEALTLLDENSFSFQQPEYLKKDYDSEFQIIKKQNLQNKALINYLKSRGISFSIASTYCFELYYRNKGKNWFAIAFINNSGGVELRNKYFKGCIGSKNYTLQINNTSTIKVFEGFVDFLSYLEINSNKTNSDYLICNSTALIERVLPLLKQYSDIDLYLDNDSSGTKASSTIVESYSYANLKNEMYAEYKHSNEMLVENVAEGNSKLNRGRAPIFNLLCEA